MTALRKPERAGKADYAMLGIPSAFAQYAGIPLWIVPLDRSIGGRLAMEIPLPRGKRPVFAVFGGVMFGAWGEITGQTQKATSKVYTLYFNGDGKVTAVL